MKFDLDGYARMQEAGVTHVTTVPWRLFDDPGAYIDTSHVPLEKMCDGLERYGDEVIAKVDGG